MAAWYVQWYGYVPAAVNVYDEVAPAGMSPVFQTPVSLVAVCTRLSLFFQLTVVPTSTVIVEGVNAIADIVTTFEVDGGATGVAGDVGDIGTPAVEPLVQPDQAATSPKRARPSVADDTFFIDYLHI